MTEPATHRKKAALVAGCSSLWNYPLRSPHCFTKGKRSFLLPISQKNRLRRAAKAAFCRGAALLRGQKESATPPSAITPVTRGRGVATPGLTPTPLPSRGHAADDRTPTPLPKNGDPTPAYLPKTSNPALSGYGYTVYSILTGTQ